MREAVFSVLGQHLDGVRFLDGFGGAGVMGLEAWSRGATVTVVEKDRRKAQAIRKRADELGAELDLRTGDLWRLLDTLCDFDVVFLDPPYAMTLGDELDRFAPVGRELVIEAASRTVMPTQTEHFERTWDRRYGDSWLHRYERSSGR